MFLVLLQNIIFIFISLYICLIVITYQYTAVIKAETLLQINYLIILLSIS